MSVSRQDPRFDLCNKTWGRITRKYGRHATATDFSPKERVVVLVWTVFGIVENGGFLYLFSSDLPGDPGYRQAIEAFREIGCDEAARTIEDAIAAFPDGKVPGDETERKNVFGALPRERQTELAARIWDLEEEVETRLAEYIRKHGLQGPGH